MSGLPWQKTGVIGFHEYSEHPAPWRLRVKAIAFLSVCFIGVIISPIHLLSLAVVENVLMLENSMGSARHSNEPQLYRLSFHFPAREEVDKRTNVLPGILSFILPIQSGGAVWGNVTWGHAVSRDLIHWLDLEPALVCDHWYDIGGVWSGSVTIRQDGSTLILYTGVASDLEQTQNMAVPKDLSDPLLRNWVKIAENPILRHPDGMDKEDFRDPTTAWQVDDGSWRITVGAQVGRNGMALLYKSDDLWHWDLDVNLLHTIPGTGMWECVDYFPVALIGQNGLDTSAHGPSIKHVLKATFYDGYLCRSSLLRDVDSTVFWIDVRVLPTEDFLSLRVLVDHSMIESFVQGGRFAITARIYPKEAVDERAHVFLFNNGTSSIIMQSNRVWQMNGVSMLAT